MAQKLKHTWGVGFIAIVIVGLIGYALFNSTSVDIEDQTDLVNTEAWAKGPSDAVVTLVEFADFQCPACSSYHSVITELVEKFPNDLRIEFRYFPLVNIHSNAALSARGVEAAGKQGKFWEMHDILFQRQDEWSRSAKAKDLLEDYATEIGLNLDQYKIDIKSRVVKNKVDSDLRYGQDLGVNSTPSFFINGHQIINPAGLEPFRSLIQGAIQKAKSEQQSELLIHADIMVSIEGEEFDMTGIKSDVLVGDSKVFSVKNRKTLANVFENMGMKLTEDCLLLVDGTEYCQSNDFEFVIMVNEEFSEEGPDYVIKDLDRILILVGSETEEEIIKLAQTIDHKACFYSKNCSKNNE